MRKLGVLAPVDLALCSAHLPSGLELPTHQAFPLMGRWVSKMIERGHQLCVFNTSREISSPFIIRGKQLSVWLVPHRKSRSVYDFYRMERQLLQQAIKQSGCHYLHAHWSYEFGSAALDCTSRCLVTAHDNPGSVGKWNRWTRIYPHWAFRGWLGRRVLRRCQLLSSVSSALLASVEKYLSRSCETFVTPNGVSEDLLHRGEKAPGILPKRPWTIVTIAQGFYGVKNGMNALRAFFLFRKSSAQCRLIMIGSGYEPGGEADRWARVRRLTQGVIFLGHQDYIKTMSVLEKEADVFLHCGREESFCMSALEAMALKIPVVAGISSGNLPDLLSQGQAGLLVDINNPAAIAGGLENLRNQRILYERIALQGHQRARIFSEERMIASYEAVYHKIWPEYFDNNILCSPSKKPPGFER